MKVYKTTVAVFVGLLFTQTTNALFTIDFSEHKDGSECAETVIMNNDFQGCFQMAGNTWWNDLFKYGSEDYSRNVLLTTYASRDCSERKVSFVVLSIADCKVHFKRENDVSISSNKREQFTF